MDKTKATERVGARDAVAGLCLFVAAVAFSCNRQFFDRTSADVFFSISLASYIVVLLAVSRIPVLELLRSLMLAAVLIGIQVAALNVPVKVLPSVALVGVSGFLLEIFKAIRKPDSDAVRYVLLPPLLLILYEYFGSSLLGVSTRTHPQTLDVTLYKFDQGLGVQPSCFAGRLLLPHRRLAHAAVWLYYALPVPMMLLYARQLGSHKKKALRTVLALFLAGILGVALYDLVPACGPIYLLGSRFPWNPPAAVELTRLAQVPEWAPRNAFPSLHLSWALLIWWYSKGDSWRARGAFLVFLLVTAFVILGIGEHYFVDLVAAFPFSVAIESFCSVVAVTRATRAVILAAALAMLSGWVILMRSGVGVTNSLAEWGMVAGTIVGSLVGHYRLWFQSETQLDAARSSAT